MPKILSLAQVAKMFGVGPDQLIKIHEKDPIPGCIPVPAGAHRKFWDSKALRRRAALKRQAKEQSLARTAWKYNLGPQLSPEMRAAGGDWCARFFDGIPFIVVSKAGIDYSNVPDKDHATILHAVSDRLRYITKGLPWWKGDLLLRMKSRGTEIPVSMLKDGQTNMQVAKLYPPEHRDPEISFQHHAEAAANTGGNLILAKSRLELAKKNNWKPSELRAYVRRASNQARASSSPTSSR